MINNEITTTKGMESTQKALEQAKNRVAMERKKANEERRKATKALTIRKTNARIRKTFTLASPTTDTAKIIVLSTESSLILFTILSL